ncbi:sigma factor-like helix-turn-helix DNA-binding protein [Candidatus Omnitrophota bacterium]
MQYQDELRVKHLIDYYQQRIFALAIYLIGGNHDKAYDIATSSFAKMIQAFSIFEGEKLFLTKLASAVVEKSRNIKAIPQADSFDFEDRSPERRKYLQIINTGLQALPFDEKVLLLLRDQLHLSYSDIANILRMPERNVRIQTVQVRREFRKKIEEILSGA